MMIAIQLLKISDSHANEQVDCGENYFGVSVLFFNLLKIEFWIGVQPIAYLKMKRKI